MSNESKSTLKFIFVLGAVFFILLLFTGNMSIGDLIPGLDTLQVELDQMFGG